MTEWKKIGWGVAESTVLSTTSHLLARGLDPNKVTRIQGIIVSVVSTLIPQLVYRLTSLNRSNRCEFELMLIPVAGTIDGLISYALSSGGFSLYTRIADGIGIQVLRALKSVLVTYGYDNSGDFFTTTASTANADNGGK